MKLASYIMESLFRTGRLAVRELKADLWPSSAPKWGLRKTLQPLCKLFLFVILVKARGVLSSTAAARVTTAIDKLVMMINETVILLRKI